MPDRVRDPNQNRTPSQDIPDALNIFGAQQDIADFAPTMKGGLDVGESALRISSGANAVSNGGFEEGIGTWTPQTASTTLAIQTGVLITEGSQSLKLLPDGTDITVGTLTPKLTIEDGVGELRVAFDVRFHSVVNDGLGVAFVWFYDINDVFMSVVIADAISLASDTWQTMYLDAPVPPGAAQFVFSMRVDSADPSSLLTVNEYAIIDNVIATPSTLLEGMLRGTVSPESRVGASGDYQPTATQSSSLGTVTNYARWTLIGKMMFVQVKVTTTAAGTAGNAVVIGLPFRLDSPNGSMPVAPGLSPVGIGHINGFGSGNYGSVTVRLNTVNTNPTVVFLRADINTVTGSMGIDPNAAVGIGAVIEFNAQYLVH